MPEDPKGRLELVLALLARTGRRQQGRDALRVRYPRAPEAMIDTGTHHLYGDLPEAAVDLLACMELSLRQPAREVGLGAVIHLQDHLYNWLQFQALLPDGREGLRELVAELEEFIADGDTAAAKATVAELKERLDGMRSPPDLM